MMEINDILVKGITDEFAHVSPKKALNNLTAELARKRPNGITHSCWEQLHHIVIWQEPLIEALKGNEIDWEYAKQNEWPSEEIMKDDSEWEKLVSRFFDGLAETEDVIKDLDLSVNIPAWPKESMVYAGMMLVLHNSYHIGQIVTTRMALDVWPPTEA